jgi:DNA-binding XRE family transcriptional regulator
MAERKTIPFKEWRDRLLKEDPALKAEYDNLKPAYDRMILLIKMRQAAGLSRRQVAERMKSSQSVVTRLETDHRFNPSLELAVRYAKATGHELHIVPREK